MRCVRARASSKRTWRTSCSAASRDNCVAAAACSRAWLRVARPNRPSVGCATPSCSVHCRSAVSAAATSVRRASNSRARWMTPSGLLRAAIPAQPVDAQPQALSRNDALAGRQTRPMLQGIADRNPRRIRRPPRRRVLVARRLPVLAGLWHSRRWRGEGRSASRAPLPTSASVAARVSAFGVTIACRSPSSTGPRQHVPARFNG